MRNGLLLLCLLATFNAGAQKTFPTYFEKTAGKGSPTYHETIAWWKALVASSPQLQMRELGPTDAGEPLHLVLVSGDRDFNPSSIHAKGKTILFVNNGIHPGEPDGIDASMLLARDIVLGKYRLPANVVLAIIPVYNIDGALNRSKDWRVDQNGPVEKGSRGNGQNLDLNRDFIKADSKNALSFIRAFRFLDPDVFIDNHVSNGADYQHVMTLLTTQHNKMGGAMGDYLNKVFEPALYPMMKQKGFDLVPYVNHFGETPDKGWPEFFDSPRYSSGYTTLWNTFGFVPETHMLKPYAQRVAATRALMECFIAFLAQNGKDVRAQRLQTTRMQQTQQSFPIAWKWDRSQKTEILFKGYASGYKTSEVSGLPRLYYDRSKPYEMKIPFYNTYRDTLSIKRPEAYIIPQGWWKVIERLQANGVQMRRLSQDTTLEVEAYRIENYTASPRPYEGHHLNTNMKVSLNKVQQRFRKGDYYISTRQPAVRFLIEVLEPQGEDSYFAWNFFDPILGQKEGFSDYVFEETAAAYLRQHPELRAALNERKVTDSAFAKSAYAQLDFVYKHTPYYEPGHMQYPVFRIPAR
jgi:hypothetical protein